MLERIPPHTIFLPNGPACRWDVSSLRWKHVALLRAARLGWRAYMDTYINRKQVLKQYGFDVRDEQWSPGDVQERPKGVGKEKWYRQEAVAAKAVAKLESVPVEVEGVVVAIAPELPQLPVTCNKEEVLHSVVVAKRAMNFRFVIGTEGEIVRVQDNKRVKIGMRMAVRSVSPGHYVSKEVVR